MALASGLALAAALPWMLASCATTEAGSAPENDPSKLPEAGAPDSGDTDAAVDGGCDPSDPACVTKPITCDEADWCPVATNVTSSYALTAVWGTGASDVWASGSSGTVLHWDGAAWVVTTVPSDTTLPIKNTFHALWGSGPNDVWVASATNVIFHSDGFKNGTATWVRAPDGTGTVFTAPIYAAWGTNADDVRFGGASCLFEVPDGITNANQLLKKPSPNGIEWSRVEGTGTIYGIWGSSADDIWMVADNSFYVPYQVGQTLHGVRTGKDVVWSEVDSRASVVLRSIWGSSASDVWAVGDAGTIRHFGANATEWSIVESPTHATLHGVWGSGPNDVWVVGEYGAIFHWDGTAWKASEAVFPVNRKRPHLFGVWGSGPSDVWIVGDGIALHHTGGAK